MFILNRMLETIAQSRIDISPFAPKTLNLKINTDKIRDLIGPGGKMIRAIQTETGTRIEVDDTGLVKIYAATQEEGEVALQRISAIVVEPEVGTVYEGKVVKTTDFGAFVQIMPGTEGLVHISQLSKQRVKKVTDVVKEGDTLQVKVLEISKDGKIRLSHRALLEEADDRS
jgi:polyribonucleotide nucleotidyltransferase